VSEEMKQNYTNFRESVMEMQSSKDENLKQSYFKSSNMLHITLLMLNFTDDLDKLEKAKQVLKDME
jgi:hypothetical protein